jgi:hypothetical protein
VARRKNPRTLLIQHTRTLKTSAEQITRLMTLYAARTVWIPREEQTEPGVWQRPRRPEEHVDNRPLVWLKAREELVDMSRSIQEADLLIRFKLATLGRDARGVDIGAREALSRFSPVEVAVLLALEVWDGSLPQVP